MAGIRLPPEDSELPQPARPGPASVDLVSDDDRSVAADSWSIKSEYGSTLDDDQRHADAAEALLTSGNFRAAASDYSSDKEEPDADGVSSMLGLQSYWDSAYADELTNFREHGHVGEVWFGSDVMDVVVTWTRNLCIQIAQGHLPTDADDVKYESGEDGDKHLCGWSVLDIGTGNGLLLQELAKLGFSDLTGVDYSEGAVNLARSLADRDGYPNIKFLVDDILETKLDQQFKLVMDKGTLDAIGLHPDGNVKRIMYWDSVSRLVAPGGLLVITSCNSTKDELVREVENYNRRGGSQLLELEARTTTHAEILPLDTSTMFAPIRPSCLVGQSGHASPQLRFFGTRNLTPAIVFPRYVSLSIITWCKQLMFLEDLTDLVKG